MPLTRQGEAGIMRAYRELLLARQQELEQELAQLRQDIEDLEPPEPQSGCIRFEKRYQAGGTVYSYAAVRSAGRLWSVTGPRSPQQVSWKQLLTFIREDNVDEFHQFTEVVSLGAPRAI